MDYFQVGFPRFLDSNEISQPPHERMTKLKATMAKLERVHVKCATSQVPLIEVTRITVQIQPTLQWPRLVLNLHLRKNNLNKRRV